MLRKILIITAAVAALASCTPLRTSDQQAPKTGALAYEAPGPVIRAPLSPLGGSYAAPPPQTSGTGYAPQLTPEGWQASPRWAAINGNGCIEVQPDEAGAGKTKIENCSKGAFRD